MQVHPQMRAPSLGRWASQLGLAAAPVRLTLVRPAVERAPLPVLGAQAWGDRVVRKANARERNAPMGRWGLGREYGALGGAARLLSVSLSDAELLSNACTARRRSGAPLSAIAVV